MYCHYRGLLAQWYDNILENETKDIEFYKNILVGSKGKVLELACGTGRLLVPFCQLGVDIEGLDISSDMLSICRKKLAEHNLSVALYEQDLAKFNTGKQYKIIFISGGSFQLLDDIAAAMSSLNHIYAHLQAGGQLILDLFHLWSEVQSNQDVLWRLGRTAKNKKGEKFCCYERTELDPMNQIQRGRYKYELYRNGVLVKTIMDNLNLRWYGRQEFKLMLEKCGFTNIQIETHTIMSTHGESMVYYGYKS